MRVEPGASELLFGDDWESDPFVYSLYADIVAGRVRASQCLGLLEAAGVHRHYLQRIEVLLERPMPAFDVDGIFILRQRGTPGADLAEFGPRLHWFDDYFECSLRLYAAGLLDSDGVVEVASALASTPSALARGYEAVCARSAVVRERLVVVRRALTKAGLMEAVAAGRPLARVRYFVERMLSRDRRPALPLPQPGELPDYRRLVEKWSRQGRKEALNHD